MLERLSQIDNLTIDHHHHLGPGDVCLYYGDYTARQGYDHSQTNQLIRNLKKSVLRRGRDEYHYKEVAMNRIAQALVRHIRMDQVTFVPVPPSKARNHVEYDDRMLQILARCHQLNPATDYRELVVQTVSTEANHATTGRRQQPADLEAIYAINRLDDRPLREYVIMLDDMLTTGSHFVAMRNTLHNAFPGQNVAGLFVARRVPEAEDPAVVFADIL